MENNANRIVYLSINNDIIKMIVESIEYKIACVDKIKVDEYQILEFIDFKNELDEYHFLNQDEDLQEEIIFRFRDLQENQEVKDNDTYSVSEIYTDYN